MIINEKTLLPISFVIAIMGGVAWLTNVNASVNVLHEKADAIARMAEDISKIQVDIAEIRGELKRKP